MVDIHAHILPGIDDGAEDIYDTLEMAQLAADSGVRAIVATPHCNIPGVFENYFGDAYLDAFYRARDAIRQEQIPIELYPGMEVFATYDLPQLLAEGRIMTLNQGHYLLLEFAFDEDLRFAEDILQRVSASGVKPVIAHAERYEFVQEIPEIVYDWRKKGYAVQINKGSFLGRFGKKAFKTANRLLEHQLVSVVASDAHSPYCRTPYMQETYELLNERFSREYLDLLFLENPQRICQDQPLAEIRPLPFER